MLNAVQAVFTKLHYVFEVITVLRYHLRFTVCIRDIRLNLGELIFLMSLLNTVEASNSFLAVWELRKLARSKMKPPNKVKVVKIPDTHDNRDCD